MNKTAIGGDEIMSKYPDCAERTGEDGMISIDGIVDAYVYLPINLDALGRSK